MDSILKKQLKLIAKKTAEEQPILLGALLSRLFFEKNVLLTIVGGAAVQFYSQAEYTTGDLDAILIGDTREIIEEVMHRLGFSRATTYRHFEHSDFNFVVEFPSSPVEVGNRPILQFAEVKTELGNVRILRIEDIIMDRIIAGVEWKSEASLSQARLLYIKHSKRIDQKYLKEFAQSEGYSKTLQKIMKRS